MNTLATIHLAHVFWDIDLADRTAQNGIRIPGALCGQLSGVLSACLVADGTPTDIGMDDPPAPTGSCITMEIADYSDPENSIVYFLSVYDSAEVYLYNASIGSGAGWLKYALADSSQYLALKASMEALTKESQRIIHSLTVEASPDNFKPYSTTLRLRVFNEGASEAKAMLPFSIMQKVGESWRILGDVMPLNPDAQLSKPREYCLLAFDLTTLPGGQAEGEYRIMGSFSDGVDTKEFAVEYKISKDATDIGYPPIPTMTSEQKELCDKYMAYWGFYSPFDKDFTEQSYFDEFHPYLLFMPIVFSEGKRDEFHEKYPEWIPAEIYESTLQSRFLLSSDQFRKVVGERKADYGEYYDPAKNAYFMPGGYGGGSCSGVVTASKRDSELLTLSVSWYGMDDGFVYSHDVTIRVVSDDEFYYVANKVTGRAELSN